MLSCRWEDHQATLPPGLGLHPEGALTARSTEVAVWLLQERGRSGEAGAGRGDQIRGGLQTGALSPPRAVFCGAGPHSLQVSAPLSALCCCVSLAPKERLHRGQKRPAAQPRLDFRRSLGGAGGGGGLCPQAVRVPQGGVRPALPDLVPSRVCPQAVAGCVGRTVSPVSLPTSHPAGLAAPSRPSCCLHALGGTVCVSLHGLA